MKPLMVGNNSYLRITPETGRVCMVEGTQKILGDNFVYELQIKKIDSKEVLSEENVLIGDNFILELYVKKQMQEEEIEKKEIIKIIKTQGFCENLGEFEGDNFVLQVIKNTDGTGKFVGNNFKLYVGTPECEKLLGINKAPVINSVTATNVSAGANASTVITVNFSDIDANDPSDFRIEPLLIRGPSNVIRECLSPDIAAINQANGTYRAACEADTTGWDLGPYSISLKLHDGHGGLASSPFEDNMNVFYILNITTPAITVQSPLNTAYARKWVWANATLNNAGSWCGVSLNGTSNQTMSNTSATAWYLNLSVPSEGANNVIFYCNGTTGDMGNSATVYFTVDTIAPSLVLTLPQNTAYGSTSRALNYTASDANPGTVWYQYNGANTTLNGNTTFTALDNQQSALTLYANDTAGNMNSTSVTFTVDTVAPTITSVPPSDMDVTVARNYTYINITSNEALSAAILEWSGTNETMQGSGTNWYLNKTGLANGNYTYKIYGNDSANNFGINGTWWVSINVVALDTTPPVITIQSPQNTTVPSSDIWFNITLDEAGSWAGYSLDGAANVTMQNTSGNWNARNASMVAGIHNVAFYANDTSGNMNVSQVVYFIVKPMRGTVKDQFGNVVSNAQVIIINQTSNAIIATTTTDAYGNWTYNIGKNGTYLIVSYNPNNSSQRGDAAPFISVP